MAQTQSNTKLYSVSVNIWALNKSDVPSPLSSIFFLILAIHKGYLNLTYYPGDDMGFRWFIGLFLMDKIMLT